jgi:predicted RNA-binding protein with RPS1 domain
MTEENSTESTQQPTPVAEVSAPSAEAPAPEAQAPANVDEAPAVSADEAPAAPSDASAETPDVPSEALEIAAETPAEAPAAEPEAAAPDSPPQAVDTAGPEEETSELVRGDDVPPITADAAPSTEEIARRKKKPNADPRPELRELTELVVQHPEIGPPLARLAAKIGQNEFAERIIKMGLGADGPSGMEYFALAVDVARRESRYDDVFKRVDEALAAFGGESPEAADADDEKNRLLHIVRTAFAVLLFDIEDVNARPAWAQSLADRLIALQSRYENDAFYFSLLAQARWFDDKEASEAAWEKAIAAGDGEFAWNARGTWYKDAAGDFNRAKKAYRKGLEQLKDSALLLHNLAQLLADESQKRMEGEPDNARKWLKEADELVHRALKKKARRGLRRYIHGTKDRIQKLQSKLPAEEIVPPNVDDVLEGRVVAVVPYGCFVTIRGGIKGLLHVSELSWDRIEDPSTLVKQGDKIKVKVISVEPQDDGTVRVGFSRKQLLKKPEGAPDTPERVDGQRGKGRRGKQDNRDDRSRGNHSDRGDRRGGDRKGGDRKGGGRRGGGKRGGAPRSHTEDHKRQDGMGSLGEMLLAKLEEKKSDDE